MKPDFEKIKNIVKGLDIDTIGLFGSRARGDNNEDSDYDIFMISKLKLEEELRLEEELEKELNKTVDLIQLNGSTDKRLAKNIINDGIIIMSKNDEYIKYCNMIEWFYRENSDFIEKRKRDLLD